MSAELQEAIVQITKDVEGALADHRSGRRAPLSPNVLSQVLVELEAMARIPGRTLVFPRFLLDWHDETGLRDRLLEVAYRYERSKNA